MAVLPRIGSVKVISILESLETPESVRFHAIIDIYADMRVLREKGGGANRGYIMREIRE